MNSATLYWSACTNQESERSSLFVLEVLILPLSTILIFDFEIMWTVWYFFFHFITLLG
jgi:hypothetical protein